MPTTSEADLIWQQCLFAFEEPSVDASFVGAGRIDLDEHSWVEHVPGWLHGADLVFAELVARLPWRRREVTMYDRRLPEPRLTAWVDTAVAAEPLPVLAEARRLLTGRYERPFDSLGFNLYRDGRDSVAWHADRERRELRDPVVVVLSVGSPRPFRMRPMGGGPGRTWELGQGDLFVMGGACQHEWEHCVPKVAHAGPRLSIMFRHHLSGAAPG